MVPKNAQKPPNFKRLLVPKRAHLHWAQDQGVDNVKAGNSLLQVSELPNQNKQSKPNLPNQTKPSKPNLPNQACQTKSNLQNQTYQTKRTQPNLHYWLKQPTPGSVVPMAMSLLLRGRHVHYKVLKIL